MLGHPSKYELFEYAEGLVGGPTVVAAKTAAHVAQCRACAAEAEAICRSLAFMAEAADLEASITSNIDIMLAARRERRALERRRTCRHSVVALGKGLACAAGLALIMTVTVGAVLQEGPKNTWMRADASPPAAVLSPEAIRRATAEIRTLAAAVQPGGRKPQTAWEQQGWRVVQALNDDIAEARAALERNPGCARAAALIHGNLARQAETLRRLYADREL